MVIPEEMGKRVKELKKKRKISYKALAVKTGLNLHTIRRIVEAGGNPSVFTLDILADFFGVSLDYLTGRTE